MSLNGLSELVVTIMAAGHVSALDAKNPRLAHEAIARLDDAGSLTSRSLLDHFGVQVVSQPDPDVGLRVSGLTRALWDAVSQGYLRTHEDGTAAWFILEETALPAINRRMGKLPSGETECLQRVGADWAARSTRSKKRPSSPAVAGRRALRLA